MINSQIEDIKLHNNFILAIYVKNLYIYNRKKPAMILLIKTGKSKLKTFVRNGLRRIGYDIVRYHPATDDRLRKKKLMENYNIDIVMDVGANVGKYGVELRSIGFDGRIISFEPLSEAFSELEKKADQDDQWFAENFALGNKNEIAEINIAGNSLSSSLLDMLPVHVKSAPESEYIGKEKIEVKKMDSVFDQYCSKQDNILLKIDTQGFEKHVIEGASKSLKFIDTIQMEMSLIPLYKDEMLCMDLIKILNGLGYSLVHLEHVFSDIRTGRLLQVDGIFHRFSPQL